MDDQLLYLIFDVFKPHENSLRVFLDTFMDVLIAIKLGLLKR